MKRSLFSKGLCFALAVGVLGIAGGIAANSAATPTEAAVVESVVYTCDFSTGGFSTGTNYQGTVTHTDTSTGAKAANSSGVAWKIYYGNWSTSGAIDGTSAQMRLYKNGIKGYLMTETDIIGLSKISYKAYAESGPLINVSYSIDQGSSWNVVESDKEFTTSSASPGTYTNSFPVTITDGVRIRFDVSSNSPTVTSTKDIVIDDIAFTVSKSDAETTSVTITGKMDKTAYASGEAWDTTGLIVTAKDSDNVEKVIAHDDTGLTWKFDPADPTVGGTSGSVTATYDGVTSEAFSFNYTCAVPVLQGIEVTELPTTTSYDLNDTISYSGIKVVANYDVGDSEDITGQVTYDPTDGSTLATAGTVTVTVSYESGGNTYTDTFDVTVFSGPIMDYTFSGKLDEGSLTLDEVVWTFSIDDSKASPSWNGDSRGMQIGSSSNASSSTFRSEIISGYRISRVVVNAAMGSSGDAELSVSIGDTAIGTKHSLTTSATEYSFEAATPVAGHIQIRFELTKRASYIKTIQVFAAAESDGVANAAKLIEAADVCNKTGLDAAINAYDALTEAAKTECNAIKLDDYANGDTAHANAKTYNLLSVAEKIAAIRNAAAEAATSQAINLFGNGQDNGLIAMASILGIGLGTGAVVILARKKKRVR